MFIRAKKRDDKIYLQIVENKREDGKVIQHVKATLGRLDILLMCSGSDRAAEKWTYILGARMRRVGKDGFSIDTDRIRDDERYDGKWVLQTNSDIGAWEAAIQYKQLWTVEEIFRTMKSILDTRPIYHHCTETIRGHVFCSFLALMLRKVLHDKLEKKERKLEWADIINDIDKIEEIEVTHRSKKFIIRTECSGVAGKVFQAAGISLPPVLRQQESRGTTPELPS